MYIKVEDLQNPNARVYSYEELRALYPQTSIPTVGDFYAVTKQDPEDPESEDVVQLAFYKIDYSNAPETQLGHDLSRTGYFLKEATDDAGSVGVTYQNTQRPLNQLGVELKNRVSQLRKQKENEGLVVDGEVVMTTVSDQNRITSVLVNAARAGIETIRFKKSDNTFATITVKQLEGIADVIATMVQGLFDAEEAHFAAIDQLVTDENFAGLVAYDTQANWPSNVITNP